MKENLTIKEFAELAKVSPQSIYKRLKKVDNPIQAYIIYQDDQILLDKSALKELYKVEVEQTTTQPSLKVEQPYQVESENAHTPTEKTHENKENESQTASHKVIEILREQIKIQREEIQDKNKVIADLNQRLADSQKMLDQQQKLSMADKQQILMLENKINNKRGIVSKLIYFLKGGTSNETNI